MKSTIGAIALIGGTLATAAAIALAGSAAFAETAVEDQRARLAILWGQEKAVTASRTADARVNFIGISSVLGFETTDQWAGDHSAGRVHAPARR